VSTRLNSTRTRWRYNGLWPRPPGWRDLELGMHRCFETIEPIRKLTAIGADALPAVERREQPGRAIGSVG